MEKIQKQLIDTYARKRLIVDSLMAWEIKYFSDNNFLKEKIRLDNTKYFGGDIADMLINDINMVKYFDFQDFDHYRIESLLEYLDREHEEGKINFKDLNYIIGEMFKSVNVNNFKISEINWFIKYYPLTEPYLRNRLNKLKQDYYDNNIFVIR